METIGLREARLERRFASRLQDHMFDQSLCEPTINARGGRIVGTVSNPLHAHMGTQPIVGLPDARQDLAAEISLRIERLDLGLWTAESDLFQYWGIRG